MPSHREIEAQLTGPGGPFEIVQRARARRADAGLQGAARARCARCSRARPRSATASTSSTTICGSPSRSTRAWSPRSRRRLPSAIGIGKGDRVAILAANCPEWIVSFWAALSLGAIAVGLNGWWAGDEILLRARGLGPEAVDRRPRRRLARIAGQPLRVPVVEIEQDFEKLWSYDPRRRAPGRSDRRGRSGHASSTRAAPRAGRRAPSTRTATSSRSAACRCSTACGLMLGAGQGGPPALSTGACMLMNTPVVPRLGPVHRRRHAALDGRQDRLDHGPLRPRAGARADRAREGHELGPDGHHDPSRAEPSRPRRSTTSRACATSAPAVRRSRASCSSALREAFPQIRSQMGLGYGLTESTALATINSGDELEAYPDSVGTPAADDRRSRSATRKGARFPRARGRDPPSRPAGDEGVLAQPQGDRARRSCRGAGCAPATSGGSRTAASPSSRASAT